MSIVLHCQSIKDFSQKLTKSGSILGVDYGLKKTGLSFSNKDRTIAMPYKITKSENLKILCNDIKKEAEQKSIDGIVIGYPLDIYGNAGHSCERVHKFVKALEEYITEDMPYFYQDERFSSKQAERLLDSAVLSKKRRKETEDDSIAAHYILQTALDLLATIKN